MHAVARAPELYHAYIGVAQMANQLRSEKRAYDYMLGRCRAERRAALARKLEAAPVTLEGGVPPAYLRVRDEAMHALGVGTMREMRSVVTGLFLPSLRNRDYTLAEKINLWRGKAATGVSTMWKEMLATDLAERVPGGRRPRLLPPRRARLHLHLRRGVGLLRQPDGAAQGLLHLQRVRAQSDVRRARQGHGDSARGRAQGHQPPGRQKVVRVRRSGFQRPGSWRRALMKDRVSAVVVPAMRR